MILKVGERVNEETAKAAESQCSRNIYVIFDYFRLIFLRRRKWFLCWPLPGISGHFGENVIVMSKDATSLFSNLS